MDGRILILDDDDEIRSYLTLALGSLDVLACAEPAEVPADDFAVALIDLMLPGGRSDATIAALTARGIPVVAMTGLSETSPAVAAARQAGAVAVLPKPFTLTELRTLVSRYTG